MYLLERLFGIGVYIFVLLFICFIILNTKSNNIKKVLNFYVLCLLIMAYFFVPPTGEDLYRIIPLMEAYASLDISQLFSILKNVSTPISVLYYYLIGKLSLPGLLPAITALIVYSNVFYIIKNFSSKYEISNKFVSKVVFYVMSVGFFVCTISNIRTMLAFSILAVTIYREMFENQSIVKSIPFYVISFLIHTSSIMIIIVRFLSFVFFEMKLKYIKKICLFIIFCLVFKNYFFMAFEKFKLYYSTESLFLLWEFVKISIFLIYLFYIIRYYNKLKKIKLSDDSISKLSKFISLLSIFVVLLYNEFNIYLRVSYFCSIMLIPVIMYNFKQLDSLNVECKNLYTITLFSSLIMLFLSCSRGHLSSLKFFDFSK